MQAASTVTSILVSGRLYVIPSFTPEMNGEILFWAVPGTESTDRRMNRILFMRYLLFFDCVESANCREDSKLFLNGTQNAH